METFSDRKGVERPSAGREWVRQSLVNHTLSSQLLVLTSNRQHLTGNYTGEWGIPSQECFLLFFFFFFWRLSSGVMLCGCVERYLAHYTFWFEVSESSPCLTQSLGPMFHQTKLTDACESVGRCVRWIVQSHEVQQTEESRQPGKARKINAIESRELESIHRRERLVFGLQLSSISYHQSMKGKGHICANPITYLQHKQKNLMHKETGGEGVKIEGWIFAEQSFLCQKEYLQAMLICLQAVEQNKAAILADVNPNLVCLSNVVWQVFGGWLGNFERHSKILLIWLRTERERIAGTVECQHSWLELLFSTNMNSDLNWILFSYFSWFLETWKHRKAYNLAKVVTLYISVLFRWFTITMVKIT